MALDIPLPTDSPYNDPAQYAPLLLSAIEGFLESRDVWSETDYDPALAYMGDLKSYLVETWGKKLEDVGSVKMWMTATPPEKWILLEGQAISRAVYADLFALWGTDYGNGNGTTTFNVPDFRYRSPMGVGGLIAIGETRGQDTVQINQANLPNVSFPVTDPGHNHQETVGTTTAANRSTNGTGSNVAIQAQATTSTTPLTTQNRVTGITVNSGGSGQALNVLHPVIGCYMIAYAGV